MIIIRKSKDRGNSQHNWLNSFHTFSFAEYYDPKFMGFSNLRVINEDIVQPGCGFGRHAHHNMEIISYVVKGSLSHSDSMDNGSVINPGEIQKMSAGRGVEHSEYNHSSKEPVHFLQIWILPEEKNIKPSYEQKTIPKETNKLILIGSREGGENAVMIHQNIKVYLAYLQNYPRLSHHFQNGKKGWLQLIKGEIMLNNLLLSAGDGAAITQEEHIHISCEKDAELLLFELD